MSKFDALGLDVERPYRVILARPDDKPWATSDGASAYVDVLSMDSEAKLRADEEIRARRSANKALTPEDEMAILLSFLTAGWRLVDFDGNVICDNYARADGEEFYSARGRRYVGRQVFAAASAAINFLPAATA